MEEEGNHHIVYFMVQFFFLPCYRTSGHLLGFIILSDIDSQRHSDIVCLSTAESCMHAYVRLRYSAKFRSCCVYVLCSQLPSVCRRVCARVHVRKPVYICIPKS